MQTIIHLPTSKQSKLGASQIQWLSELAVFDFVIKYRTGHSNQATDALSCCPFNPSCDERFTESEADNDEWEVISYSSVCKAIDLSLNSTKIPKDLKQEAQNISCAVQSIVEEEDKEEIVSSLNAVSIFKQITPEKMAEGSKMIQLSSWFTNLLQWAKSQKHWL